MGSYFSQLFHTQSHDTKAIKDDHSISPRNSNMWNFLIGMHVVDANKEITDRGYKMGAVLNGKPWNMPQEVSNLVNTSGVKELIYDSTILSILVDCRTWIVTQIIGFS